MRRGMQRGRGNNRPMQRQQNQRIPGGPLATDHLQGLKDIDTELELLKRKREIIEQQQHMLSMSDNYRPQRNDYEQSKFNQSRDDRYEDYPRMYENPRDANNYGGGGASNRKRPIQVWEHESPSKRFNAPSVHVKKTFGSRLGPPPNNQRPAPPANFQMPRIPKTYKPRPNFPNPQKKRDFNPTKVTKSGTAQPPVTKLDSYQPAERKQLVTEATKLATKVPPAPIYDESQVLRSDREPTRKMAGRLELALGSIMKEMKLSHPEYEELFFAQASNRAMKQAVRERIRTAMVGKVVGTAEKIRAIYQENYPEHSHSDVLLKGLEAHQGSDFIPITSDDPEVYFKKNISRLLSLKLEEMIEKLEELYCKENPGFTLKKRIKFYQPKQPAKGQSKQDKGQSKTDEIQSNTDETQSKTDETQPKIDETQPKTDEIPSKIEEITYKTDENQSTDETHSTADMSSDEPMVIDENQALPDEPESKVDGTSGAEETQAKLDDAPKSNITQSKNIEDENQKKVSEIISTEKYKALEKLMTFKIAHLLKRLAPALLRVIDIDGMYRKTKSVIIEETRRKLVGDTALVKNTVDNSSLKATPMKHFNMQPLPYYVKILGKPGLPKRKAMASFFEQFKPKSIKKHKNVHNLLFVGFADKEPFDNILAANGTVIGRFMLDIKVSERNNDNKNQNTSNATDPVITSEDDKSGKLDESGSDEKIIGSDLDEQITDLLTSIRKAEEMDGSDDVVIYDPEENKTTEEVKEDKDQTEETGNENVDQTETAVAKAEPKTEPDTPDKAEVAADDVVEIIDDEADVGETDDAKTDDKEAENAEKNDAVAELKIDAKDGKATPVRTSARLATPSSIRTRRASKLQN